MDTVSQLSTNTLNRNVQYENRIRKHGFHNLNRREKSITRISNKELYDILEDFSSRNQNLWDTSISDPKKLKSKTKTTTTLSPGTKPIKYQPKLASGDYSQKPVKPKYLNPKSVSQKESDSCYLVKNLSPTSINRKMINKSPLNQTNKKPSNTKPRISNLSNTNNSLLNNSSSPPEKPDIFKFNCDFQSYEMNKIGQMEIEYQYLEKRVNKLKKELKEMHKYLVNIKKMKNETEIKCNDDNDKSDNLNENQNKINCLNNKKTELTVNNDTVKDKKVNKQSNHDATKIKSRNFILNHDQSNSNTSSHLSECTMVSSSFMNELSHKIISNSSDDSSKSDATLDSIKSCNLSLDQFKTKLFYTPPNQNFVQKFWNGFKSNLLNRRNNLINNNTTENIKNKFRNIK